MKENEKIIKILEQLLSKAKSAEYKIEGTVEKESELTNICVDSYSIPIVCAVASDSVTIKLKYNYDKALVKELKLEDVYYVTTCTEDRIRIYSTNPLLIDPERANFIEKDNLLSMKDGFIVNTCFAADRVRVFRDVFVDLIKEYKSK